jgi:hypothetical protein
MGTIKDLVDLVTQLLNSVKDRKIAEELREIQTQASILQSDQASLHEANMKLREENLELKDKIRSFERKIEELSEAKGSGPSDVPICPNCSTTGRPFYMRPVPRDFIEIMNATHECPKCEYNTRVDE